MNQCKEKLFFHKNKNKKTQSTREPVFKIKKTLLYKKLKKKNFSLKKLLSQ